jgi:cell division protein ZapE
MITFRGHASGVIWFEFAELCGGPRSQLDYLRLAESHALVLLSGVPCMSPAMAAAARRFTWLIDILYDHRVPLALSCEVSLDRLYSTGTLSAEFVRTVSRLEEMQSAEWRNRSPVAPHNTNGSTP